MKNKVLVELVNAVEVQPIVIEGAVARQFAIFGVMAGVSPQKAALFLLGRSAEQLLDPADSFGADIADMLQAQLAAEYIPTLNRPPGAEAWRQMLEDLSA